MTRTIPLLCLLLVSGGCQETAPDAPAKERLVVPEKVNAPVPSVPTRPAAVFAPVAEQPAAEEASSPGSPEPAVAPVPSAPVRTPTVAAPPGRRSLDQAHRQRVSWNQIELGASENSKGLKHHRKARFLQALQYYRQAWETNPNHIYARYNAACAHAMLGDKPAAMAMIEDLAARGGHAVRRQMRWARKDSDLLLLRKDPRFVELTEVPDPLPVFTGVADTDVGLDFMFLADPYERLCLWMGSADVAAQCAETWVQVVDCTTNRQLHKRHIFTAAQCAAFDDDGASASDIAAARKRAVKFDNWLQDLGMIEWAELDAARAAKAQTWFEIHLAAEVKRERDEEELAEIRISPTGRLIAFHHLHIGDDMILDDDDSYGGCPKGEPGPNRAYDMTRDGHNSYTIKPAVDVFGAGSP